MKIDAIVLDCADAAPLARFWAAALGWRIAPYDETERARLAAAGINDPEDDPTVLVEPPAGSGLPRLFLAEVPEPKSSKNRMHLDLQASTSLDVEAARLQSIGATITRRVKEEHGVWIVMADPQGNEFCVVEP